jgi:aryl carrier-like protein
VIDETDEGTAADVTGVTDDGTEPDVTGMTDRPSPDVAGVTGGGTEADVAGVVARAWGAALRLPDLPATANFFALGGDSLIGVLLADEVNQRLGVAVDLTDLVEAPTLAEFTARVTARLTPERR